MEKIIFLKVCTFYSVYVSVASEIIMYCKILYLIVLYFHKTIKTYEKGK